MKVAHRLILVSKTCLKFEVRNLATCFLCPLELLVNIAYYYYSSKKSPPHSYYHPYLKGAKYILYYCISISIHVLKEIPDLRFSFGKCLKSQNWFDIWINENMLTLLHQRAEKDQIQYVFMSGTLKITSIFYTRFQIQLMLFE